MAFLETPRFPECFMLGASGGPAFATEVDTVYSGEEYRIITQDQALCRWQVGQVLRPLSEFKELLYFFRAVRGRGHGFRVRDPFDYAAAAGEGVLVQLTGTTWQMVRRYQAGSFFEDKTIYKPVSGTNDDGAIAIQGGGTYTFNATTGVITKTGGADPTGWTGPYDKPARFDIDVMETAQIRDRQGGAAGEVLVEWPSIPIVELRNPLA